MDNLGKYFSEHRTRFDDEEPADGHVKRFEAKYNQRFGEPSVFVSRSLLLKIAAGILIFLTVSVFLFDFSMHGLKKLVFDHSSGVFPAEIQQAEQFYRNSASERLGDLPKLACCGQDTRIISSDASEAMGDLDKNYDELQKAYA